MTNSRLTDPEVLEWRYPVRVEEFRGAARQRRRGRAPRRRRRVRRLRFLEPLTAAIVSSSRRVAPYGLAGGLPGACGRNAIERADGSVEELPGVAQRAMQPGDVLIVETPGGGGYGAPPDRAELSAIVAAPTPAAEPRVPAAPQQRAEHHPDEEAHHEQRGPASARPAARTTRRRSGSARTPWCSAG